MIHWHNIYWLGSSEKLQDVCDIQPDSAIYEIDVIYHKGDVMCSHSWRPFKCMMYGKADNYFKAFKGYKGQQKIYLYVELKTDDEKIVFKLKELMRKNHNENVIYIVGGKSGTGRESIARQIFQQTGVNLKTEWAPDFFREHKDEIEKRYLYRNKLWWRRLNHF
jgi:hypothetical protein